MTVPTSKESKENMKHSSSWPDRAVTVKVRVHPVSRAYTVIPALSDDRILGVTSPRSGINEPAQKLVSSEKNESHRRLSQAPERSRSDEGSIVHCPNRRESIDRKDHLISRTLNLSLKTLGKSVPKTDGSRLVRSTSNIRVSPGEFSEVTKLNKKRDSREKKKTLAVDGKLSSGPVTHKPTRKTSASDVDKASHFVISTCKVNSRASAKPPVIKIIDYDDVSSTYTGDWQGKHACPKCKSHGFLELQIDPFRSPVERGLQQPQRGKNNCVESGTFPDRRFCSRSTTYDCRRNLDKSFERRTKSFAGNLLEHVEPNESPTRTHPTIDHKKEMMLRRHYYPEGGWGYVVVTCSALVHFIGIGLQLAAPGSWHVTADRKFHHPALHSAGKQIRKRSRIDKDKTIPPVD